MITDEQNIKRIVSQYGREIRFWDDGFGPLWVYRESLGRLGYVRALTWEEAYECVLDEILDPIPVSELHEAYGFDSQAEFEEAVNTRPETMELCEGYQYQSNSTGTGIVAIDLNGESLDLLTPELLSQIGDTIEFTQD